VLVAFTIGGVLLWLLGANPFEAYWVLLNGAFGSVNALAATLTKMTPLLLVALGICISFRGGVINIGGEGQIIVGALASTAFALWLRDLPGWLLLTLTLFVGALAGAAWGAIAGVLKARLNVNEILSTVMLNAIALQLMNFLLRGPMLDPEQIAAGTNIAQSEALPRSMWLLRLAPPTLLHAGVILALVLAVLVYLLLWRTTIGYRIRTVGLNPSAARYAGMPVPFYVALSLTLAGAFAGLAGAVEVAGVQHRMLEGLFGRLRFQRHRGGALWQAPPAGCNPCLVPLWRAVGGREQDAAHRAGAECADHRHQRAGGHVRGGERSLRPAGAAARRARGRRSISQKRRRSSHAGIDTLMDDFLSIATLVGIAHSGVRLATPYLYAAIGEMFGQRSGVLNLGVEGVMLMGAFAAYYAVFLGGDPWLGVLAALVVGALMGLLMAIISVTMQAEQGISGIGLSLFGLGLSSLLLKVLVGSPISIQGFPVWEIPGLSANSHPWADLLQP
jgi:ABC-type uncharacterized transport system permease subunit